MNQYNKLKEKPYITTLEKRRVIFQKPFIHEGSKYMYYTVKIIVCHSKTTIAKAMKLGTLGNLGLGQQNTSLVKM